MTDRRPIASLTLDEIVERGGRHPRGSKGWAFWASIYRERTAGGRWLREQCEDGTWRTRKIRRWNYRKLNRRSY